MKSSEPKPPWHLLIASLFLLVFALYVTININDGVALGIQQCDAADGTYVRIVRGGEYVCVPKGVLN